MELVKKLPFVKAVKARNNMAKEKVLGDLQESIDELKLIKAGKKKARNLDDFLHEL